VPHPHCHLLFSVFLIVAIQTKSQTLNK
jgi:hypothetical protein